MGFESSKKLGIDGNAKEQGRDNKMGIESARENMMSALTLPVLSFARHSLRISQQKCKKQLTRRGGGE